MLIVKKSDVDFGLYLDQTVLYGCEFIKQNIPALTHYLLRHEKELKSKESGVPASIPFYSHHLSDFYFANTVILHGEITVLLRAFIYRFLQKHEFIEDDGFVTTSLFPATPSGKFYNSGFLSAWNFEDMQEAATTLRQELAKGKSKGTPEKPKIQIIKHNSYPKFEIDVPEPIYTGALKVLEEWTSDSKYHKQVSHWFEERKDRTEFTISFFPYLKGKSSFFDLVKEAKKHDSNFNNTIVCKLIRVMAFNYYAEEFLNESLQLNNNINVVQSLSDTKTSVVLSWDESPYEEIQEHLDKSQQHFEKVETVMNTLTKFENTASANVHLIHGRPAEDYTEDQLMELIRKARKSQDSIKDLVNDSSRMKKKHEELEEAIKVYVAALDQLA